MNVFTFYIFNGITQFLIRYVCTILEYKIIEILKHEHKMYIRYIKWILIVATFVYYKFTCKDWNFG